MLALGPPVLPRTQRKSRVRDENPSPSKWLLNWCDSGETDDGDSPDVSRRVPPDSIYVGFRVSEERLAQFLDNHLSLREAILHSEFETPAPANR